MVASRRRLPRTPSAGYAAAAAPDGDGEADFPDVLGRVSLIREVDAEEMELPRPSYLDTAPRQLALSSRDVHRLAVSSLDVPSATPPLRATAARAFWSGADSPMKSTSRVTRSELTPTHQQSDGVDGQIAPLDSRAPPATAEPNDETVLSNTHWCFLLGS
jgi:hypothetical protein